METLARAHSPLRNAKSDGFRSIKTGRALKAHNIPLFMPKGGFPEAGLCHAAGAKMTFFWQPQVASRLKAPLMGDGVRFPIKFHRKGKFKIP